MTLPEETPPGQSFDEDNHPRRRQRDQGVNFWAGWLYRHTVPALAIVVAALAVLQGIDATSTAKHAVKIANGKADRAELKAVAAQRAARQQVVGRRIAIDVLCGFGNGVAEAGRKALAGELQGQHPARGLSKASQRDYVQTITSTLLSEAGITAQNVIRPDGEVNCPRLRNAAKATHP